MLMYLEIESYTGDCVLYGRRVPLGELKKQLRETEQQYDRSSDNFVALLCIRYGWQPAADPESAESACTYDRDTGQLLRRIY